MRILAATLTAAALAGVIVWEAQGSASPQAGVALRDAGVPDVALAAPVGDRLAIAQAWLATAQERPLFRVDRRPATPANDATPKSDGSARLTGVLTGPFDHRAIFVASADPKPIIAREGDRVGGFLVRSIAPGRVVVVEAGGGERILQPSFAEAPSPPPDD